MEGKCHNFTECKQRLLDFSTSGVRHILYLDVQKQKFASALFYKPCCDLYY